MQNVIFLTREGKGPNEKLMDLVEERWGEETVVIAGADLLNPRIFISLISGLSKTDELIGIIVSAEEALYMLSTKNSIINAVKLVGNTGIVYDEVTNLARQLAKANKK